MANFGRSMLEKYGWTDGKGLGREETGISKPIKVSGNFNSYGLGHDVGKEFKNQWWDHVYNKTADNLIVGKTQDGSVQLTRKNEVLGDQKVKPYATASSTQYSSFVKEGVMNDAEEEKDMSLKLSYDELFKICGGRTAHKGARHGLKMSAKLARVEKQEQDLLRKWQDDKDSLSRESLPVTENTEMPKKKSKKKRKDIDSCDKVSLHESRDKEDFQCVESDHLSKKDRKDKKKKKKLHCVENEISCEESLPLDEGSSVGDICPADPEVGDREVIKKTKKKKKKSTKDEKENTVETAMAASESEIVEKKKKHKKRKKEKEESENLMCEDLTDSQQCKDSSEMEINEGHKKKKKKHKNLL